MRSNFVKSVLKICENDSRCVFLTGDLGYLALEPLKEVLGNRFINAGVAEQNMVSVAAAMANEGLKPWLYSIAPFLYARPFEQIRNDVCLHNLPVVLIANGGGFGYGVMGPTHHALEDYGVLSSLHHMTCLLPAFVDDLPAVIERAYEINGPVYIRLGANEKPKDYQVPDFAPWRCVKDGSETIIITCSTLTGKLLSESLENFSHIPHKIWCIGEMPLREDLFPRKLIDDLKNANHVVVIEEHVEIGGISSCLALLCLKNAIHLNKFDSYTVNGYSSGMYGNQQYHRNENFLSLKSVFENV